MDTTALATYNATHFLWKCIDRVATITLNRPDRKNPLTFECGFCIMLLVLGHPFFGRMLVHFGVRKQFSMKKTSHLNLRLIQLHLNPRLEKLMKLK